MSVQVRLDSPYPSCVVPHMWAIHSATGCDRAFLEILWPFTLYHQFPKNSAILGRLHCWSSKNKSFTDQKKVGLVLALDGIKVLAYHF